MVKITALSLVLILLSATAVFAANYIEPQELKLLMENKRKRWSLWISSLL
jgi:hypothetical protein